MASIDPRQLPLLQEACPEDTPRPFTFAVNTATLVQRFLILGTEKAVFAPCNGVCTADALAENATAIMCVVAAELGTDLVEQIVQMVKDGRCIKSEPPLFALAVIICGHDMKARRAGYDAISEVCGTPTQLFQLIEFAKWLGKGWGRGFRHGVAKWYTNRRDRVLAYQCTKYVQRNGWNHHDVLRKCHLRGPGDVYAGQSVVFTYIAKGIAAVEELFSDSPPVDLECTGPAILSFLRAVEDAKTCTDEAALVALIEAHTLAREHVPTAMLNSVEVWRALLQKMPITAMIRNLGKMSAIGLLTNDEGCEATALVCAALGDEEKLRGGRVHPMAIMIASAQYAKGAGDKGSLTWAPVGHIVCALDDAFYLSFKAVEPTGKRIVIGLDVSGSMGAACIPNTNVIVREGSFAMAEVARRTEPNTRVVAFSEGATELALAPTATLADWRLATNRLPFDRTDCAMPILWADKNGIEADTFIVYTDNDTNTGKISPVEALRAYRRKTGIDARLIVVGMMGCDFSIADPADAGMLDIVGFDASAPKLMADFMLGRV